MLIQEWFFVFFWFLCLLYDVFSSFFKKSFSVWKDDHKVQNDDFGYERIYFWPYYYTDSVAPNRCMVAPHRCMIFIFYQSIYGTLVFLVPPLRVQGLKFSIQNFFNPDWNVLVIDFFNNMIEKSIFLKKINNYRFFSWTISIIIEKWILKDFFCRYIISRYLQHLEKECLADWSCVEGDVHPVSSMKIYVWQLVSAALSLAQSVFFCKFWGLKKSHGERQESRWAKEKARAAWKRARKVTGKKARKNKERTRAAWTKAMTRVAWNKASWKRFTTAGSNRRLLLALTPLCKRAEEDSPGGRGRSEEGLTRQSKIEKLSLRQLARGLRNSQCSNHRKAARGTRPGCCWQRKSAMKRRNPASRKKNGLQPQKRRKSKEKN